MIQETQMEIIENKSFDQERALYAINDASVMNCRFDGPADGESAFKEAHNLKGCVYQRLSVTTPGQVVGRLWIHGVLVGSKCPLPQLFALLTFGGVIVG